MKQEINILQGSIEEINEKIKAINNDGGRIVKIIDNGFDVYSFTVLVEYPKPICKKVDKSSIFIDKLGLSVRTTNALIRAGFDTVHDVIEYFGPAISNYTFLNPDYKHINGFGPKSRRELQNRLKELGVI